MSIGRPDHTQAMEIKGLDPTSELVTLAVDAAGQLYAVVKGTDGTTLRTLAVDASGRLIMVPYGTTTIAGTATVTQAEKDREVQGKDGVTLRTLAVDSSGQLIMVPRGQSGNYMSVDASGFLTTVMKGLDGVTLRTLAVESQGYLVAVMMGDDGVALRHVMVDNTGQLIMVPRGQSGNYMSVDTSGFLTTVMKGVDGVTLRTIAVDANGKILGVLQGDYAGALKTLAVDSQGRMLAVLTDPEDVFGNPHYLGAAELAARLGALSRYHRTGQVFWQTSFEDGVANVHLSAGGTGAQARISVATQRSGVYSVWLSPGTTVGNESYLRVLLPPPPLGIWAAEISFTVDSPVYPQTLLLKHSDGANEWQARVRYNLNTTTLQYRDSAGNWQNITTTLKLYEDMLLFHTIKLFANFTTGKYVRVIVDGIVYDLANISLYSAVDTTSPWVLLQYEMFRGAGAAETDSFIDDLIFTANES